MAARRRFSWIFAGLGVVAIALVLWVVFHRKPAPKPKPPRTPVTTAVAQTADVPVSITALGAAQAWRSDTILAQVTGKLLSVPFVEGGYVKAGQLLAEVDPAPYRAALMQAQGALKRDEALLAEARVDLARYQTLAAQDSVARQTLDTQAALVKQDEGTVLADQGAVAAAQVNLNYCRITSPISGRAGVRLVDPGNIVNAGSGSASVSTTQSAGASGITGSTTSSGSGTGIVTINEVEPIAVTFTVPQGDFQRLSDVSGGFRTPLVTQAFSQETGGPLGSGMLSIADNHVDPATGTVTLKARFANADHRLWPGQFVNVRLTLQTLSHVTTIPAGAVNQGPKGAFAYVVGPDGKAVARPLKVGPTEGTTAVILSGVSPGETVVVDGQMTLKPGAEVRARPAAAGGQGSGGQGSGGMGPAT
jgi:multidrug efflux system membrane fusion protein